VITPIVAAATRFSAKLRDEMDLVAQNDDLVGVVRGDDTTRPCALWLRSDTSSKVERAD
jgi:hypothetical protein